MGSEQFIKKQYRQLGKVDALLNEKLEKVEWGQYKLGDLFEIKHYGKQRSQEDLQKDGVLKYNFVMQNENNNGIIERVPKQIGNHFNLIPGNSISAFTHLNKVYYQEESFYSKQGSNVYTLKSNFLNKKTAKFIISAINSIIGNLEYGKNTASRLIHYEIQLPTKNGAIDFHFMENFIAELENERINKLANYLEVSGLKDYTLTAEEEKVLADFENCKVVWGEFSYKSVFNKIIQGRRLTKDDQISGSIPFVMAGTTNTGVVNYISNPVASFPKNAITIDIFGNTFYRDYDFGAGDDTGVYWDSEKNYSKETMLFFTTSMEKSIAGKFDYGNKLRSSQSFDFNMKLPVINNQPNFLIMETFITAIQKLVIKDVVLYADKKIEATKK